MIVCQSHDTGNSKLQQDCAWPPGSVRCTLLKAGTGANRPRSCYELMTVWLLGLRPRHDGALNLCMFVQGSVLRIVVHVHALNGAIL